jgi:hypothetical protein
MATRRQSAPLRTSVNESSECYYVYLCSGEVQAVAPADSLELSSSELAILLDGATVASFPRSLVFSCSRTLQSSPVLG